MTTRQKSDLLIARDEVVAAPVARACNDQTFELPGGLYAAMITMFAGFIAVLALSFRGGHMAVGYGVIFALLAAYFAIPTIFPRMAADSRRKALSWTMFRYRGIQTATERSSATEATVLVLLLPSLILCFGIAVATIAALV